MVQTLGVPPVFYLAVIVVESPLYEMRPYEIHDFKESGIIRVGSVTRVRPRVGELVIFAVPSEDTDMVTVRTGVGVPRDIQIQEVPLPHQIEESQNLVGRKGADIEINVMSAAANLRVEVRTVHFMAENRSSGFIGAGGVGNAEGEKTRPCVVRQHNINPDAAILACIQNLVEIRLKYRTRGQLYYVIPHHRPARLGFSQVAHISEESQPVCTPGLRLAAGWLQRN